MKKIAALLLAACLALQPCAFPVMQASGASGSRRITAGRTTARTESALEVKVASSSFFPYHDAVTVKVQGSKEQEQTLDFTDKDQAYARFQVPAGDYTVTVSSKKFASYKQLVSVQAGWTHKMTLCPVQIDAADGGMTGWLRPGDINGDGTIDRKDEQALLTAVHNDSTDSEYDINSDGHVDVADMKFLTESMHGHQNASVEKLWILKEARQVAGTIKSGSLEELIYDGKPITAGPANTAEVSADNPIAFEFTLSDSSNADEVPEIEAVVIDAPLDIDGNMFSQIADGTAEVIYLDQNSTEQKMDIPIHTSDRRLAALSARAGKSPSVHTQSNGSLVLDLGGQIAVKRITIRITGTTKKEQPLVEIARVEFVNHMADRIPEPQMDIPAITSVKAGSKMLTVSWKPQNNITGYELQITGPVKNQSEPQTQIFRAPDSVFDIHAINNQNLKNHETYTIKVRSVNGDWKSPWSAQATGVPTPQEKPAAPDYVKAVGGAHSVTVTWKDMDDADGYMVYYKQTSAKGADFGPVVQGFAQTADGTGKLEENKYTITGLLEQEEYSVYVVGWNQLGWGQPSLTATAVTKTMVDPVLPSYKLLNTSNGKGSLTAHIKAASYGGSGSASMVDSPLDTEKNSALGLVDDNYASYWYKADWDDGVAYAGPDKGMNITLDADYQMNYFTFAAADQKAGIGGVKIQYWNSSDASAAKSVGARLIAKTDSNDNPYYIVKLDQTVTANKIHMWLGNTAGNANDLRVGEIHFHHYDSLEDDIMGMYTDAMHTTLRADVTEAVIQALESRLHTADAQSGEQHPLYQELALEIQTAREILNGNLDPAVVLSSQITAKKDGHLGFGGLNAWQPLGKTAHAGETLLVYVGHNTKRTGDAAEVQLVFTQHHAEAVNVSRTQSLRVGRNEISVPQLASTNAERGGQLYAAYTGNHASDQYAVRISGGSNIPVLNVYGKTGAERTQALQAYVAALKSYVPLIKGKHDSLHAGTKNVNYDYGDGKNCILDATDILMGQMMYSLPATQVLAGLGNASDPVEKLDRALKAMDDAMALFYHHKGLSNDAGSARGNHALPSQHLNIRYMRMFAGAFMYASGNHIGIEWGSATLATSPDSMNGFGWGIAHEIGHNINQGAYAVAEVTNNYFSQLLTGTQRYQYENVYKKVTSGATGRASNVFTQLAMYWQLHLAYDNHADDRHIYSNYEDQFQNIFFARVDTYARDPKQAPQAGLSLDAGADQNLMRLACAAANKNILPFFERWGMVPDDATAAYAGKYGEAEKKALYYVNEDARTYRLAHPDEDGTILNQDAVSATVAAENGKNQVTVSISQQADTKKKEVILGYEISRTMISNGKKETKVAGFVPAKSDGDTVFTDIVSAINNRVMYYEVRAVDKFLNYSKAADAGSVKIQTDGMLNKENWTAETTMAADDPVKTLDENDPDSGYDAEDPSKVSAQLQQSIGRMIDGSYDTVYTESASHPSAEATITIDMHKVEEVTAVKYQGSALSSVTAEVSTDGTNWKTVKKGYQGLGATGTVETLWFDAISEDGEKLTNWVGTYDARYVRLSITKSAGISVNEIDICGPSGDNLEFMQTSDQKPAFGILAENWNYGDKSEDVIPKGSLIFTGTYQGNPAYNAVLVYDTKGNIIGARTGQDGQTEVQAGQVITAPHPEDGHLGNTSEGTWIYYIEPTAGIDFKNYANLEVRAELYRVDDAMVLKGERIVSDTTIVSIPDEIPEITITGNSISYDSGSDDNSSDDSSSGNESLSSL